MEVKTSDETYHLWITDLKNGKESVKGVKQYLEQTIPLTEDTETLSSTNSSSSPERLAGEPSDNYWKLIKWHFYIVIVLFLLFFTTVIIGDPPENPTFSSSPLASSTGFMFVLSFVIGHISICYFISKDKYELDKYNDNIRTRHWLTLIVFTYLSQFLYLLFYPLARIIKDTSGSSASADGDGS
jgi:magnesium-transporting ATPase (P-type)